MSSARCSRSWPQWPAPRESEHTMAGGDSNTLKSLYPFLHGRKQEPRAMNAALLEAVDEKVGRHRDVIGDFFAKNAQAVIDAAGAIARVYQRQGRLFTMGNGGSSCD